LVDFLLLPSGGHLFCLFVYGHGVKSSPCSRFHQASGAIGERSAGCARGDPDGAMISFWSWSEEALLPGLKKASKPEIKPKIKTHKGA
jgi:hypothetical protein